MHSGHPRDECVDFFTLLFSLVVFRGSLLPRQEQKVQQLPEGRLEVRRRDWLKTIHFRHVVAPALVVLSLLACTDVRFFRDCFVD